MTAEGVLYGPKLHRPSTAISSEPSRDPGNGETSTSACGFFSGIVYSRAWIDFHHPDLIECRLCFPSAGWVIRDDWPTPDCNCGMPSLGRDHSRWCASVRHPGGTFYYAGRDLEGHWWMGRERAATFTYRDAQKFVREANHPRRLTIERRDAG